MMLQKKVDQSKRLVETVYQNMDNLVVGFSGGKDSVVMHHIIQSIGLKIPTEYANTTIDPAGTKGFIKTNFPEVVIRNPKESFYQLVARKGFPTRLNRYCCVLLKEYVGVGRNMLEGVRSDESRERQGRDYIQCDSRKSYKGGKHIYPIYDWTTEEVWQYTRKHGLPVAPCYKQSGGCMTRLGCVGCPLAGKYQRIREFEAYPKHHAACEKAIEKGMANNPQWKLSKLCDGNAALAMKWWLSRQTMNEFWGLNNDNQPEINFENL